MKCPKCLKLNMEIEEHGEVAVRRCQTCKGLFLGKGQLTALLHQGLANEVDRLDYSDVSDQMEFVSAACPKCDGQEMDSIPGPGGVRIDRCPTCGSLFLDQGKLATIALHRA